MRYQYATIIGASLVIGSGLGGTWAAEAGPPSDPTSPAGEPSAGGSDVTGRLDRLESEFETFQQRIGGGQGDAESSEPSFLVKYNVKMSGFVNLDASWDDSQVDRGDFLRWVESEATRKNDSEFNMSPYATRLRLSFDGPSSDALMSGAVIEFDFMGGGASNSPLMRMRHAYITVGWSDLDLEFLFGQTWDVIQPLHAPELNFVVGWWSGNIGFRRPQARVTKGFDLGGDSKLTLIAAAARTLGDPQFTADVGGDAGFPTMQGRAAFSFVPIRSLTAKASEIGVSGHFGEQECDTINEVFKTWSVNFDLKLALHDKVTFLSEFWMGQAMCVYLGSIGVGINQDLRRAIHAMGGWGALSFGPYGKFRFNLGGLVDDPLDRDLSGPRTDADGNPLDGMRSLNVSAFANVMYQLNEAVRLGLEVMHMVTNYKGQAQGDTIRIMTQARFSF